MTTFEATSIVGLFAGPIFAAVLTIYLQERNARYQRKLDVFKTLMRTRRVPISADHVAALNLVEVEFYGDPRVLGYYKALMGLFSQDVSLPNGELSSQGIRIVEDRRNTTAKLLQAIAKNLKYNLEQLDIVEGGYHPQGFVDFEGEQTKIRKFVLALSSGNASLPVSIKTVEK